MPRTGLEAARVAAAQDQAQPAAAPTPEEQAVRVLLRQQKARLDGVMPPASWPEKIRRVGTAWVADIDTRQLPGGYPEQLVVEVTTTGGHTGRPKR
jgi:hypothetical protein